MRSTSPWVKGLLERGTKQPLNRKTDGLSPVLLSGERRCPLKPRFWRAQGISVAEAIGKTRLIVWEVLNGPKGQEKGAGVQS